MARESLCPDERKGNQDGRIPGVDQNSLERLLGCGQKEQDQRNDCEVQRR